MSSDLLSLFNEFMDDPDAWDMFITGPAGTGKTTGLSVIVEQLIANKIPYRVCAFTHKACDILRGKLPVGAEVQTLHSFLKKRPTINSEAMKVQNIEQNAKFSESEKVRVLLLDEYSQVGEKDLMDIRYLQDPEYEGAPALKVVYIGDRNQLPPVKDMEAITPRGKYWHKLSKVYRTKTRLLETMTTINDMIDGVKDIAPLERHDTFQELGDNWLDSYKKDSDSVVLAYTNARVQELNFYLEGKTEPEPGDKLFSNTNNSYYTFIKKVDPENVTFVHTMFGDVLTFNSKYKTLEYLLSLGICDYYIVEDFEGEQFIYPVLFGTYNYKAQKDQFGATAAKTNQMIQAEFKMQASHWANKNYNHPMARKRAKAWRDYITLKETVVCMDFTHAMTVHKSQGSTFHTVYIDANDLALCATRDVTLYLRLFYVALSRASHMVITN